MEEKQLEFNNLIENYRNYNSNNARYERKILGKLGNAQFFRNFLISNNFVKHHPSRIVNSIYYDTIEKKTILDNINGESKRFKIRLRFYDDSSEAKIELKIKHNQLGYKKFFHSPDSVSSIIRKPVILSKHLLALTGLNLFPSSFISYRRSYFLFDNFLRATIDSEIKFKNYNINEEIFDDLQAMNHEILEFKYPKEFDQNFRFIYKEINCPFRVTKSSKYVLANLKY